LLFFSGFEKMFFNAILPVLIAGHDFVDYNSGSPGDKRRLKHFLYADENIVPHGDDEKNII
jgi:hypothetical protein